MDINPDYVAMAPARAEGLVGTDETSDAIGLDLGDNPVKRAPKPAEAAPVVKRHRGRPRKNPFPAVAAG